MKVISYMVPVAMLLLSFLYNNNPFIIKDEAHQAFELINNIRSNHTNPNVYTGGRGCR